MAEKIAIGDVDPRLRASAIKKEEVPRNTAVEESAITRPRRRDNRKLDSNSELSEKLGAVHFRTGNAVNEFRQIDGYIGERLRSLGIRRKGRALAAGEVGGWTCEYCEHPGPVRLRGLTEYAETPLWETA